MLRMALLFLIIALVAGALGLVGTEYLAAHIAWILFVIFLILAVVSMVVGRVRDRRPSTVRVNHPFRKGRATMARPFCVIPGT